jgi:shikimate dehydrogenase
MDRASVDRYFVLGNPVAHSQSPFIHEAFAQQTGQMMSYGRRLCPMDGFAQAVRALAADHDGGPVRGCNVTLPFKFEVPALATRVTPRARLAQAANVLRFDDDAWLADNTDGVGLVRDLQVNERLELSGRQVLLIGAGGASAGVLGPLLATKPARLLVVNRTASKAQRMVLRHQAWARQHGVQLEAGGLDTPAVQAGGGRFDLVINASASSMGGDVPAIAPQVLADGCLAVDLMYGPPAQTFLDWARAHGATRTVDGLGMLVEQAAEAFELWRGVRPQTPMVLQALRQRLTPQATGKPP